MYRVLEYEVKRNTKLEGEGSVPHRLKVPTSLRLLFL